MIWICLGVACFEGRGVVKCLYVLMFGFVDWCGDFVWAAVGFAV